MNQINKKKMSGIKGGKVTAWDCTMEGFSLVADYLAFAPFFGIGLIRHDFSLTKECWNS